MEALEKEKEEEECKHGCEYVEKSENIYKLARKIKRSDNSLFNALRSIFDDSLFVQEIRALWPQLPLLANLRCGLWYSSHFDGVCYFKSTDGHTGNWSFSSTRLNLHVASLAGMNEPISLRFFASLESFLHGCLLLVFHRRGFRV